GPTAVVSRALPRPSLATSLSRALGDFARLHPRTAAVSFALTLALVAVCMILWLQEVHLPAFIGDDAAPGGAFRWSMLPETPLTPSPAPFGARNVAAPPAPASPPPAGEPAPPPSQ